MSKIEVPPGFVALKIDRAFLIEGYTMLCDKLQQGGMRPATLMLVAAFIVDMHSRASGVPLDQCVELLGNFARQVRAGDQPDASKKAP